MHRIAVVVTARPSWSRIRSAVLALRRHQNVEVVVIAAASTLVTRYGNVVDLIREDGLEPIEVSSVIDGDGGRESALSTGVLLTQLAGVFANLKPDMVVTVADRHETLATAIAASYQNIPLCHVQGGEVSGSIDDKVRNAVTMLSDVHLVATEQARGNIIAMRGLGTLIKVTGCPSIDLAWEAMNQGPIERAEHIVLQHPVTTEAELAGFQMAETIKAMEGLDTLYFWPGEDAGGAAMSKELRIAGLHPIRNLPGVEFLRTVLGAKCIVGNSSVGIRECSFLGIHAVNIGSRQAGRERGSNVSDVPHEAEAIRSEVLRVSRERHIWSNLYGDGHAGERIAAILAGKMAEAVA